MTFSFKTEDRKDSSRSTLISAVGRWTLSIFWPIHMASVFDTLLKIELGIFWSVIWIWNFSTSIMFKNWSVVYMVKILQTVWIYWTFVSLKFILWIRLRGLSEEYWKHSGLEIWIWSIVSLEIDQILFGIIFIEIRISNFQKILRDYNMMVWVIVLLVKMISSGLMLLPVIIALLLWF